jgi:hypothetical protein
MRLVVGHVLHLEVQVVVRKLRMLCFAVPFRGSQRVELAAERVAVGEILGEDLSAWAPGHRDEHLIAIGIFIRHDGGLFHQHSIESIAEDRFHAPEMADQFLHRPFVGHAACRERGFVETRREALHFRGLRAQALHQCEMHLVFVAVMVMIMLAHADIIE